MDKNYFNEDWRVKDKLGTEYESEGEWEACAAPIQTTR